MSDDIKNPYEDELEKAQASLELVEDGDNKAPVLTSMEELIEAGKVGVTWNEFLEIVQWLSIRYTKGDDTPSEWTDIQRDMNKLSKVKSVKDWIKYFS